MELYNDVFERYENEPDLSMGQIIVKYRKVIYVYQITKEEISHEEVIAEYPETGGKDVEIIVDSPEEGFWEIRDFYTNEKIGIDDSFIDDSCPHDAILQSEIPYDVFVPFTPEELEENLKQQKQFELEQQQKLENDQLLGDMPDILCAMYEENLQLKDTIDQQEEVLCAMYEELIQVKDDSAIAYAESIRPY